MRTIASFKRFSGAVSVMRMNPSPLGPTASFLQGEFVFHAKAVNSYNSTIPLPPFPHTESARKCFSLFTHFATLRSVRNRNYKSPIIGGLIRGINISRVWRCELLLLLSGLQGLLCHADEPFGAWSDSLFSAGGICIPR